MKAMKMQMLKRYIAEYVVVADDNCMCIFRQRYDSELPTLTWFLTNVIEVDAFETYRRVAARSEDAGRYIGQAYNAWSALDVITSSCVPIHHLLAVVEELLDQQ